MRTFLLLSFGFALALTLAGRAAADADSQAVVEKAIKAHGGLDKLSKVKAAQSKMQGTIHLLGGIKFTGETFYQEPNQFKTVLDMEIMGMNINQTVGMNGDKIWIQVMGKDIELDDKIKAGMKEEIESERLVGLVMLKKKDYELSALGEAKVGDRDAVGVRVSAKGKKDVNLFFDKETGMLVKMENRAVDPMSGEEVTQERILSEYKDMDGMKRPSKILINRDGKKFLEAEITEVKAVDKFDDSVFAKP
jgi:hypothetical protein